MQFSIYVHDAGATWLDSVAGSLGNAVQSTLRDVQLSMVDGLCVSLWATTDFAQGVRQVRTRARRDYKMKIITGGTRFYRCLLECDAQLADGELVGAASTEESLFRFTQASIVKCLPTGLAEFNPSDLAVVSRAVSGACLPHHPRW